MTVPSPETSVAESEARAIAAERMTFFADAVIAIAITLLALDLPVPEETANAGVLHFASVHRGEYIAFLISFVVIGAHWSGHHRVFRYVTTLGGRLTGLTLLWLLMQVVTPFATKVLNGPGAFESRFVFYASVQAAAGLLFLLMVLQVRRHKLYRADTPAGVFTGAFVATGTLAVAFLGSIPFAFLTRYAYVCWMLIPVLSSVGRRILRRRKAAGQTQ